MSLVRWAGLAAILGGILCFVLTPIQAYIWAGADSPPLVLAARPLLNFSGTIFGRFGPRFGLDAYYFYGRMFFLVYVAALSRLALWRWRPDIVRFRGPIRLRGGDRS